VLWQGMQSQEYDTKHHDSKNQKKSGNDHEYIRIAGGSDERRQIMGRGGVKRFTH
jgi:hypothetical protein